MLYKTTLRLLLAIFTIGWSLSLAMADHDEDICEDYYGIKQDFEFSLFDSPKYFAEQYIDYFFYGNLEDEDECADQNKARAKVCLDILLQEHIEDLKSNMDEDEKEEFTFHLRKFFIKVDEELKDYSKYESFISSAYSYLVEKGIDTAFGNSIKRLTKPLNRIKAQKVYSQLKRSIERDTRINEC